MVEHNMTVARTQRTHQPGDLQSSALNLQPSTNTPQFFSTAPEDPVVRVAV
jgi:hypothetical protein